MTTQEPIAAPDPVHQLLLERVSELEERVGNLQRLEDAVRRNALLFESLLAGSRDGITLTTADATVIRVVKSILGYAPLPWPGRLFLISPTLTISRPCARATSASSSSARASSSINYG